MYELIPETLRTRKQWVMWKLVTKREKVTKIPFQVSGIEAKSTDPDTWAMFSQVQRAAKRKEFKGIGFVFTTDDPFIGIDFDACLPANPALQVWLDRFSSYCEISPSGKGLHVIIEGSKTFARCQFATPGAAALGCKCIEIYDSGRYFCMTGNLYKPELTEIKANQGTLDAFYAVIQPPVKSPDKPRPSVRTSSISPDVAPEQEMTQAVLTVLREKGAGLFATYEDFLKLAMACKSQDVSFSEFDAIVCHSAGYDQANNQRIFERLTKAQIKNISWGTAYQYAEQADRSYLHDILSQMGKARAQQERQKTAPPHPADEKPATGAQKHSEKQDRDAITARLLRLLKKLGYDFRLNEINDVIECNGCALTDIQTAVIRCQLADKNIKGFQMIEDVIMVAASRQPYHPIKRYLEGVQWNEKKNVTRLMDYFSDTHNLFPLYLRKWLIGAVGKVYGTMQNPMLVLNGDQQLGKSFFARWLCPLKGFFLEAPINPDDKDNEVRLMSNWVWEVGELGATTRRTDLSTLKFFLTKGQVCVRKAYGRRDTIKPAMASFIGTINPDGAGFLNDNTGERRFRAVTLTGIDWDYAKLDVNQLWAEAFTAYKNGETNDLTFEEKGKADEVNEEEYKAPDPVVQMILEHFILTDNWGADRLPSSQVQTILENAGLRMGSTRANAMSIAMAMKTLGRKKASDGVKRYFSGLRLPSEHW
jgi:predicted P-loop ATPase